MTLLTPTPMGTTGCTVDPVDASLYFVESDLDLAPDVRFTVRMTVHSRTKPELLAPAGGAEGAFAALQYGADAIYCGLPRFSARADAENLTMDALGEVVGYAHSLTPRRRVYAAVNTLILDRERTDVARLLFQLADIEVDGLIVQDVGVAAMARRHLPAMRLHASTQMAVHNVEGAKALRNLGFTRVVLARELSFDEVRETVASSGVEIECFVHGALCYSYSGLCLFSSHVMGRSGNRGRCAYCCREGFGGAGEGGTMPFSMNDLALGSGIEELKAGGVTSLKIEGRMKSPLYVASVTRYYRRLLDGELRDLREKARAEEDLRTVFSRPWTSLYTGGKATDQVADPVNVGHRGARIGRVEAVHSDRNGQWLAFRTSRALEKHDGIQVDLPGRARPFGFAVETILIQSRRGDGRPVSMIVAPAGEQVEVRLPEDAPELPVGAPVYCSSSQAVKRSYPVERPRPGVFRLRRSAKVLVRIERECLRASAEAVGLPDVKAEVELKGCFDAARQAAKTPDAFRQAFERTGDTEWRVEETRVEDASGLFVPVSQMHELRRDLCKALSARLSAWNEERLAAAVGQMDSVPETYRAAGVTAWSVRAANPEVLLAVASAEPASADEFVWQLETGLTEHAFAAGLERLRPLRRRKVIRLAIPAVVRAAEMEGVTSLVATALRSGIARFEIGNVGGLQVMAEIAGDGWGRSVDVTGDWSLYAMNRQAALTWFEAGLQRVTLSPEDEGGNIETMVGLFGSRVAIPVCQYTPLFISETAPAGLEPGGAGGLQLRGKEGQAFLVRRDGPRYVVVDSRPFCISDRLDTLTRAGAAHLRVDLTYAPQDAGEAVALWRTVRSGRCPQGWHDANFRRGLL